MDRYTNENLKKNKKQKRFLLLFVICLFILLISALVYVLVTNTMQKKQPSPDVTDSPEQILPPDVSAPQANFVPNISIPQVSPLPQELFSDYDFSQPVPESAAVDISYFDDAVFIGDSRTEGLILNMNLSQITAYTHKGLMVNTALTDSVIDLNGQKVTIVEALKQTEFSKVYIMLGINELGWSYSSRFIEKYGQLIDEIKAVNPNALIYVQSILPVSKKVSSTHNYVKNEKIIEYNILLAQMAAEKKVFYVNSAEAVIDENGCLPDDAATDGIHLKKSYCETWLNYLETHTVK